MVKLIKGSHHKVNKVGGGVGCSRPGACNGDYRANIEEGDPNTIEEYLGGAVEEELTEYVKEYLDRGANPNILILDEHLHLPEDLRSEPELVPVSIYAARHIQPSTILQYLVEKGAFLEPDLGTTLLIEAAEYGNLPAARYLLSIGVDINATTGSGVTAIGYAVMNGDIPMIRLMLDERRGEIDFNYTIFGTDHENVIDETADPEIARILKTYAIEQRLPIHSERQQNRLNVGYVMDKKRMPGDLTHKIITAHFGGKRKTKHRRKPRKKNTRKKNTRKKKHTRKRR